MFESCYFVIRIEVNNFLVGKSIVNNMYLNALNFVHTAFARNITFLKIFKHIQIKTTQNLLLFGFEVLDLVLSKLLIGKRLYDI